MTNSQEKSDFYKYLESLNFSKRLDKLNNKLNKKSIIIYGAGMFFEAIAENYDLSKLNIIGISDQKFKEHGENEKFLNYKVYAPNQIKDLDADYVLVATKYFTKIIEELHFYTLKGAKTVVMPLIKRPINAILKEIWG